MAPWPRAAEAKAGINTTRTTGDALLLEVAREVLLISNHVHIDAPSPHTKLYGGSAVSTRSIDNQPMMQISPLSNQTHRIASKKVGIMNVSWAKAKASKRTRPKAAKRFHSGDVEKKSVYVQRQVEKACEKC